MNANKRILKVIKRYCTEVDDHDYPQTQCSKCAALTEDILALFHESASDEIKEIREAFADYVASEGCSCCENMDDHKEARERIAKLLGVPRYSDDSGWDFSKFRSK